MSVSPKPTPEKTGAHKEVKVKKETPEKVSKPKLSTQHHRNVAFKTKKRTEGTQQPHTCRSERHNGQYYGDTDLYHQSQ